MRNALTLMLVTSTILAACSVGAPPKEKASRITPVYPSESITPERKTFTSSTVAETAPALPPAGSIDSIGSGAIPALPLELMTENGISYISGGIGDEEKEQLIIQEAQFNLRLLLTSTDGAFYSNVRMELKDASGKVLVSIGDAGPYVYLTVPTGAYTVDVTSAKGSAKSTSIKVPAKSPVKTQIRF
jgi:hypothetical protein